MLEIIVASLYFTNKVFLSLEKKAGWLIGFLAAVTAAFYFWNLDLYILFVLELGYLFLMAFGFLNFENNSKLERIINALMILVMSVLFLNVEASGWLEFTVSIGFIVAIYALAKHFWKTGWVLLIFSHLLMAYITHSKGQNFFCFMQIASIGIAVFAIFKKRKTKLAATN